MIREMIMPIMSKVKQYCEHCGDPIPEGLIMVDGFYRYNSLACANCTDYDDINEDPLEYEEDYDQPYDD
jgi:hypothetical protein